jgi:hypothetical protein
MSETKTVPCCKNALIRHYASNFKLYGANEGTRLSIKEKKELPQTFKGQMPRE